MSDHQKLCYGCGLILNVSNFAYCGRSKDKLKKHCMHCATQGDRPVEAGQKQCPACAKHLSTDNFGANTRTQDGFNIYCRICVSRMNCDRTKRRRSIILSFLHSELGCRMCGEKDWRVLEADHIDRETKGRTPSGKRIRFQSMPISKLLAELTKAQFLCGCYPPLILHCLSLLLLFTSLFFSCHRHKTHLEREELLKPLHKLSRSTRSLRRLRNILHARMMAHKINIGSCAACGRAVGLANCHCQFEWDHQVPKQKIANISDMIRDGSSSSEIWEEMQKCLLLCTNCHSLKSFHWDNLTDRERKVFKKLTKGHSMNINPYDGRNYFTDDRAFLQFKLCITYDMREDSDWYRPEDSFFASLPLRSLQCNNSTSFSQIGTYMQVLGFRVSWNSTSGSPKSQPFPLSRYEGDRELTLGAALVFREEKRAEGIPYERCQEDTARVQELIAKFLAWQGSSPAAPPASAPPSSSERAEERQGSSPAPPAPPPSSSPSFEEELDPEERRAWADMDRLLEDRLGRRGRKRETSAEESHPPKRHCRHSLLTPSFSSSSSSSFKEDKRVEEMLVRSRALDRRRKREAGKSCYQPKRRRRHRPPLELL